MRLACQSLFCSFVLLHPKKHETEVLKQLKTGFLLAVSIVTHRNVDVALSIPRESGLFLG